MGLLSEPEPAGLTFETYATKFLRDAERELKRSTWLDYASVIRRKLIPALRNRLLADIKRRDVKDLATQLHAEGLRSGNVRKHVRILSSILSAAVEYELVPSNPVLGVRRRRRSRQHEAKRQIDPLTREELARLLETARTHVVQRGATTVYPFRRSYPFLLTLARAGLRLGEAVALRWGDIDWQGRFIFVQRAYVRGVLAETKSGKTRRVSE